MRISPIQTNFTAGEFSPKLYGRQDIERYRNAAAVLENVFCLVQGGVTRRYGLRYTQAARHGDKPAELIPYVFNRDQAYMLEFGEHYIRVYLQDGAQVLYEYIPGTPEAYEVLTPYEADQLAQIDYVQSGDTMFLFHEAHAPRRLRRIADDAWVLDVVPWVTAPFAEIGTRPATTLAVDDPAAGTGRTFTAGADAFMSSDVGREIHTEGGLAVITAYTSTTAVTGTILTPLPSASIASGEWRLTGSPMAGLTPSIEKPVGATVTLVLDAAGWRAEDVGKWIEINGGRVQIDVVSSSTSATGTIYAELSAAVEAPALAWTLNGSVWGGVNGYPRTGTFFEQKLWLAGSPGFPQTIWGSRIGEYLDFELGANDDDAVSFTLASDQQNQILHLTQVKTLIALTNGGEFTLQGGLEKPITPTNVQIKNQSNFGCNTVSPERIGNELVFVQRAGRKLRAMSADRIDSDAYAAPDLTVMADHTTATGILRLAYQAEPDPLLFAPTGNGQLAVGTIDRDQDVIGWTRQTTQGVFESVARLPVEDGDQVWAIVRRVVDDETVRYVERFDRDLMTDCAITGTSTEPDGDTLWTGLDHLERLTVKVKADGVELADRLVSGGQIEIERPAKVIEIGLAYTPRVKMLRPEVFGETGTSQASHVRVSDVTCRFLATTGATVNGAPIFARQTGLGVLDRPPPLLTGDERLETLGWEIGDFELVIEQPHPYPFHLQAVITTMTVNK